MAILKCGNDEYEVRIKRYPEKTYFDEYVKTGDREKSSATSCDRYIVGEDGVRYTIEVTLKKGFTFGEFEVFGPNSTFRDTKDSSPKKMWRPEDFEDGIKPILQQSWSMQMLRLGASKCWAQDLAFVLSQ